MITQRKLPEPATVTGNISTQNSHGCDKIMMKEISHKLSKGTALYLLSFVLFSSTEKKLKCTFFYKKKATGSDGLCICIDLQHKSEQKEGAASFISWYFVQTLTVLLLEAVKSQK